MTAHYDDAPRCYSGQEIFHLMNANCGNTESISAAQDGAERFRTLHTEVAEELAALQVGMGEGRVRVKFSPLAPWLGSDLSRWHGRYRACWNPVGSGFVPRGVDGA